ncbi:photosystem reaction center subunit H [Nostoc minutum NIES-26]|uniref:Photosystem reaction center subunit H n=1 Tax=Nostoc minutum NIES-26 TaxID=1844469 RepID=A0A367RDW0_9NOSO|nr:photosystem reaction center subunit H [Nostoc minutum NIES-26]
MPLYRLEQFYPNYRERFGGDDVKALDVYTEGGMKVGSVVDALVDQEGRFRYLVIDTRVDSLSKKILLPIGLSRINYPAKRVDVDRLSKQPIERLPEYREDIVVDENYEEKVRSVFRSPTSDVIYDRETYSYQKEPALYDLNEQYHQTLRLYEERLIAHKHRIKTGEVAVSKHVETETARVSVPVEKERVVIERVQPTAATVVDPNEAKFQDGQVARIEVYEETPEIYKEAFVREEVRVKKVIDRDTVETQDTIRREELDIKTAGELHVNETSATKHEVV